MAEAGGKGRDDAGSGREPTTPLPSAAPGETTPRAALAPPGKTTPGAALGGTTPGAPLAALGETTPGAAFGETTPGSGPPAVVGSVFAEGERLADRYRVVRFVARGGMGEVYEVEDQALGERVALKTLRLGAGSLGALERFKREIQLARKVTHPNVCRIFDLGTHRDASGAEVPFLTMELLDGETLAARVARGRLGTGEARALVEPMVAGLAAAHAAGVVHGTSRART